MRIAVWTDKGKKTIKCIRAEVFGGSLFVYTEQGTLVYPRRFWTKWEFL